MKYLALLALLCACGETKTVVVTEPPPVITLEQAEDELYKAKDAMQAAHTRAWQLGSRINTAFIWSDTTQAPQYILIPRGR